MSRNVLDIRISTLGEEPADLEFKNVQYISFVSSPGGAGEGTYGIPALISEDRIKGELPVKILYVNPANIAAMEVVRTV
jgi:hypothetical protein